ncbi:hypothetical protein BaRGS_00003020, partial [Batillaria attramentaria]
GIYLCSESANDSALRTNHSGAVSKIGITASRCPGLAPLFASPSPTADGTVARIERRNECVVDAMLKSAARRLPTSGHQPVAARRKMDRLSARDCLVLPPCSRLFSSEVMLWQPRGGRLFKRTAS